MGYGVGKSRYSDLLLVVDEEKVAEPSAPSLAEKHAWDTLWSALSITKNRLLFKLMTINFNLEIIASYKSIIFCSNHFRGWKRWEFTLFWGIDIGLTGFWRNEVLLLAIEEKAFPGLLFGLLKVLLELLKAFPAFWPFPNGLLLLLPKLPPFMELLPKGLVLLTLLPKTLVLGALLKAFWLVLDILLFGNPVFAGNVVLALFWKAFPPIFPELFWKAFPPVFPDIFWKAFPPVFPILFWKEFTPELLPPFWKVFPPVDCKKLLVCVFVFWLFWLFVFARLLNELVLLKAGVEAVFELNMLDWVWKALPWEGFWALSFFWRKLPYDPENEVKVFWEFPPNPPNFIAFGSKVGLFCWFGVFPCIKRLFPDPNVDWPWEVAAVLFTPKLLPINVVFDVVLEGI